MKNNQNVKKTKMIKQKLVKNSDGYDGVDHTFGAAKKAEQRKYPLKINTRQDSNRYTGEDNFIK